jgi:hypothetical protein
LSANGGNSNCLVLLVVLLMPIDVSDLVLIRKRKKKFNDRDELKQS